ncbi:hypothetical protein [uncultured Amnibacterium sp.]|uniref:hypothetical protein n=1 Tax=uncultured Amnibacterium sp. TaxID=1631851 RepID=UPI0035CA9F7E
MSNTQLLPASPEATVSLTRRKWAGASLLAAAVVSVAGAALWPTGSDGTSAQELQAAAAHPAAWSAASTADALTWALLVPGALAVFSYLRNRGRVLGTIGAMAVVAGALATPFGTGGSAFVLVLAQHADRPTAVTVVDSVGSQPFFLPFLVLIYVGLIGLMLLMIGAARGGLVRWWVPVIAIVGVILNTVLNNDLYGAAAAATFVLPAVADVLLAIALLRSTRAVSPAAAPSSDRARRGDRTPVAA